MCAEDVDTALGLLESRVFAGIIAGLSLGPRVEGGLEVLRAAVRRQPGVPLAMVTRTSDPATVNRVASLGATILCTPFTTRHLRPFLDRMTARVALVDHLASTVTAVAEEWDLRPRERELLMLLVAGQSPERICARAGYGKATYKTYVNRLLARASCARTSDVALAVLRRATATAGDVERATGVPRRMRRSVATAT
ncbi:hypothetical protein BH11MYX4_BH11MYX4_35200 [soil metagenome]